MKATHKGSCQACGSVQMLPSGVLAKHGYTTRWGFFSGTCQGSAYQPFEKGHDRIEDFIRWAETKIANLEALKAECLAVPAEGTTEAWISVYYKGSYTRKNGYDWKKLPVEFVRHDYSDGNGYYIEACYVHPETNRPQRLESYSVGLDHITSKEPLNWIVGLNKKRADDIQKRIEEIQKYILWQRKRIAEWKEQPLLAR